MKTGLSGLDKSLKGIQSTGTKALGAVIAGVAGIGTAAVMAGQKFETSFAKVSTMFGGVNVNVKGLQKQILDLSSATGLAADELNEGLYSALSAGVPVTEDMGEAMTFLTTSTKLAKGGFTTTEKAVDAVTTVLNGYKMETKDAAKVADILLQTQNKGKTTVDQLASSIAQVTPTAAAMNVEFQQVASALATMTAQGVPTAQATTMLNSMLSELGKKGQQANENLTEAAKGTKYAGMSFQDMMKKGIPLNEVLDMMSKYAQKNNKSLLDMFGSVEAGKAALQMAGSNAQTYKNNLDAMYKSEGLTAKAADTMNDTFETQASRLKQVVSSKLIEFYNGLKEPLKSVTQMAADFISNMNVESVIQGMSILAGVLAGFLVTITAVRGAIALFNIVTTIQELGGLSTMIMTLNANIMTVLVTIGPIIGIIALIVAAIALVTGAIVQLWNTNEQFRNAFISAWTSMQETLNNIWNTILKPIFDTIVQVLMNVYENGIKPLWNEWVKFVNDIVMNMTKLWNNVKPIVDWFVSTFGPVLVNVFNLVANVFGGAVNAIIGVARSWLSNVRNITNNVMGVLNGIITFIKGVFTGNWKKAWEGIVQIIENIMGGIANAVKAPINFIIDGLNGFISGVNKIKMPDWVPVVGGKGINIPRIPRLERGGILRKGEVGLLEGNGAEAVVPLDRNKAWIRAVSKDMIRIMPDYSKGAYSQTINFYQKAESPDEISRRLRIDARLGLIG